MHRILVEREISDFDGAERMMPEFLSKSQEVQNGPRAKVMRDWSRLLSHGKGAGEQR